MKTTSIHGQTLWVAITPVIMMVILLGGYVIQARFSDAEDSLLERSQLMARSFATSGEFALFSGNHELLEQDARALMQNPEIDSVTVLDANDSMWVLTLRKDNAVNPGLNDKVSKRQPIWQDQSTLLLYQPIYATQLNIGDIGLAADTDAAPQAAMGAVILGVSKHQLNLQKSRMLVISLLIMLAVLALSIAAALWVARRISKPIIAIERDIQRIGQGALDARVGAAHGVRELNQLAEVINQMAADMQQSRSLLEQRIAEATRTLTEQKEQLERAHQESMEANRAKSNFLANMSHEIRTPMNTIIGMTQLALLNEQDEKRRDYLRKISQSGEHLLGIIDDILDFSKIDAGKLVLENTDFSLGQIKQTLASVVEWKAMEKNLRLVFDLDSGIPPHLNGDPLRLNQILINYINNAIKFTRHGEIVVRARKVEENENNILLRFEVQDSGIGISDEQKSRLFQAFQQADSSTSRQYGGTGLGLAICQRLAALMGGEVGLESMLGKGSTFWATIWIGKSSPKPDRGNEHGRASGLRVAMAAIDGARILLAEDNQFNQQVVTEFLQDARATVAVANNGEEALGLLGQGRFDCVLMDVQMPVMDGLEAARMIRADAALAGVPVIAMTANASHEEQKRCLEAGMNDFICKPFKHDVFYSTLAKWLPAKPWQAHAADGRPAPAAASGDAEAIDLARLAEAVGHDPDRMREFARKFTDSAALDIAQIEEALEREDIEALSSLGHRVKSGAQMAGAAGFARLCQVLENGKNGGDMAQLRGAAGQLRPLLERIKGEIGSRLA